MFGGGGGLNPQKMKQMMNQMGIDLEDIDAEEVIIRTADEEMVFHDADVQRMDAQGQQTYQVVGDPDSRERGESDDGPAIEEAGDSSEESAAPEIPADDVEIVAQRAGVSSDAAREALEAEDGDLAAAISRLE